MNPDRFAELRARDEDGTITEEEYIELMQPQNAPEEEQARGEWRVVQWLRKPRIDGESIELINW